MFANDISDKESRSKTDKWYIQLYKNGLTMGRSFFFSFPFLAVFNILKYYLLSKITSWRNLCGFLHTILLEVNWSCVYGFILGLVESQRKAMPKIAQATAQLHSSHMLAKQGSKFSKHAQARLQKYVNCELPDVQTGFRKGRGTRDQIANICWIIKKAREFQKDIYFCYIDYAKPVTVCITTNWKILQRWE